MKLTPRSGALAVAAASLIFAACGGGDEEEPATPAETPAEETATPSEGGETAAAYGEQVFTENCASCHTLEAAGANGRVGPNLDDLAPDAGQVEQKVIAGGGGMPSFEGQLSVDEIDAVSQYVAESAGG